MATREERTKSGHGPQAAGGAAAKLDDLTCSEGQIEEASCAETFAQAASRLVVQILVASKGWQRGAPPKGAPSIGRRELEAIPP